jgi:hypothetical protein
VLRHFVQSGRSCCHALLMRLLSVRFSFRFSSLLLIGKGRRNAFQTLAPLDPVPFCVTLIKVIPVLVKAVYSRHSCGYSMPVNKLILKKRIGITHHSDQIQIQIYFFRIYHLHMGSKKHRWSRPVFFACEILFSFVFLSIIHMEKALRCSFNNP